ncbi:MAG TPA: RNA polymerase sigma-70 factor [Chitinophaga sp.]|uniref:RNA polymerase sigma factor n=1 Tax=Chitinophaga sp. TaxID=1869181 RepID=UPI002DB80D2A|nr:RNA polymerase sigma-70 factor [Chitinophaga sp.]HEU4553648.1 RNA polymerase sigma-70 factor [Chitinophaga sp.]
MYVEPLHNEKHLQQRIAQGDEAAFRIFFDHYTPLIFTFVERLTKSRADAEEIVQDTFMKIWANRESLPFIEKPAHYCYVIARNKALDSIRKAARDQRLLNHVWANIATAADNSLENELSAREYYQLVNQALSGLPRQKQLVFQMSRQQGLSHLEISQRLGLSKSRVNNILVEALKHVKSFLDQHSPLLALLFWISAWDRLL